MQKPKIMEKYASTGQVCFSIFNSIIENKMKYISSTHFSSIWKNNMVWAKTFMGLTRLYFAHIPKNNDPWNNKKTLNTKLSNMLFSKYFLQLCPQPLPSAPLSSLCWPTFPNPHMPTCSHAHLSTCPHAHMPTSPHAHKPTWGKTMPESAMLLLVDQVPQAPAHRIYCWCLIQKWKKVIPIFCKKWHYSQWKYCKTLLGFDVQAKNGSILCKKMHN